MSMQALNITFMGIIAVSLDGRSVNVLGFYASWVRLHPDLNTHAFGHCVFFGREGHRPPPPPARPKSEGARTPISPLHSPLVCL